MFSKDDLIVKYDGYSDDELFEVYSNIDTYSEEAKQALNIVITRKGGLEALLQRQNEKKKISSEIQRIKLDVLKMSRSDADISFLKKMITSNILPPEKVNEVIDTTYSALEKEREDKKVKPRTIFGSIIGGSIASIIGGILCGLQLVYSKRLFIILLIGLALLCYGIIKLSTKQSNKNIVVLVTTIISVVLALFIGQLIFAIIGYKG